MLFNSLEFIFLFLPAVLGLAALLRRRGDAWLLLWVTLASLVFYAWWEPSYLAVLLASLGGNWLLGQAIAASATPRAARRLAALGVAANLLGLGFFKYAAFLAGEANALFGWQLPLLAWGLPLGISFFTFQQIAYLVDLARGDFRQPGLRPYAFAVTLFPHLIAGPIVRYREILPQLAGPERRLGVTADNLVVGLTLFAFGLFKKTVVADAMIPFVEPAFGAAASGQVMPLLDAWVAVLAFALQIYFDFSAYSDMAVGLARLFGIRLPANFNAPYKATSPVEFWRRWHMTLSRFLRDYLYIPLGGNRKGPLRRYLNLIVTMVLGGLWHGAGWTFLLWGLLHGLGLAVCHLWRDCGGPRLGRGLGWLLTFLFVLACWVPFRAADWPAMLQLYRGLLGLLPDQPLLRLADEAWPVLLALGVALLLPTLEQVMARAEPVLEPTAVPLTGWRRRWLLWSPSTRWALIAGLVLAFAVANIFTVSKFIYFDF